jgi:hypothetical protein
MPPLNRFVDDGKYLAEYAGEVHVKCIQCATPGIVCAERKDWPWAAVFECEECKLDLRSSRGDWVGPVRLEGRRRCSHCGHKWLAPCITQAVWPREALATIAATCTECRSETTVPLEVYRVYEQAIGTDPHFGMPLLLAAVGRHGVVWAYNAQHLGALKAYVMASLRVRASFTGNGSMFSRLPAWLKLAKNRESVCRRIAKLERLLPNPSLNRTRYGKRRKPGPRQQ